MTARHLTIVRYPPRRPWRTVEVPSPSWEEVRAAIEAMDDCERPIVQLSWRDVQTGFDDEQSFNVIGGSAVGFALFEFIPGWRFEDPDRGTEEVRLWQSDQGYYCERRNILADVEAVLRLAQVYFLTGSYDEVRRACAR